MSTRATILLGPSDPLAATPHWPPYVPSIFPLANPNYFSRRTFSSDTPLPSSPLRFPPPFLSAFLEEPVNAFRVLLFDPRSLPESRAAFPMSPSPISPYFLGSPIFLHPCSLMSPLLLHFPPGIGQVFLLFSVLPFPHTLFPPSDPPSKPASSCDLFLFSLTFPFLVPPPPLPPIVTPSPPFPPPTKSYSPSSPLS